MNFLNKTESGLAQLVVLGVMALMAVALPLTTSLVKKNQENRSKAADEGSVSVYPVLYFGQVKSNYSVGETFSIVISVDSAMRKIGGVDILGTYDAGKLDLLSIEKSRTFVFDGIGDCVFPNKSSGNVAVTCYVEDSLNDKEVKGELVKLNFLAKADGQTKVSLTCNENDILDSNIVSDSKDVIVCNKMAQDLVFSVGQVGSVATPTPIGGGDNCVTGEGVSKFSMDTGCENNGFRYMNFGCYDGYSGREGGPTSCKSAVLWNSYADDLCRGRKSKDCGVTPTLTPIVSGRNLREGKYINLDFIKDYKSVISDDKLALWLTRLDKEYESLADLTGRVPFDGRKITIREYECDENGYGDKKYACMYWAWAGEVTGWASGRVEPELKKINDTDDWSFGMLHEISHNFDTDGWNFDGELMANFKMAYFLEKSGGKIWQNDRFYTSKELKDYYKAAGTSGYNDVLKSGNYTGDFMTYKLLNIKDKIGGWETYKKVFRTLSTRPLGSDLERLNAFFDELTSVSKVSVRSLFTDEEQKIIKNRFGGGFDAVTTTPKAVNVSLGKPYSYTTESCKSQSGVCATYSKALSTGALCGVDGYTVVGKVKTGLCPGNTKTVCCTNVTMGYQIISTPTPEAMQQTDSIVDGKCGAVRNDCIVGTVNDGDVPDTSTDYKWRCLGLEGGKNVVCSLSKKINGKCGDQRNVCLSGSVSVMTSSSNLYKWRCVGRYGGSTVTCSVKK